MLKVRAHTCYLGKTGYAAHARSFFRELSKHVDLRVRNYTWDDNPDYLNDIDYSVIDTIALSTDGRDVDYHISRAFPDRPWKNATNEGFDQDIDIVLMDMNHYYFYEEFNSKVKIAYTVWESTELPDGFFKQLLKFDYLWVVTDWHKQVAIAQGYPEHRIFIVHEGVDNILYSKDPSREIPEKFQFLFFGRWDYRKAVPEILKAFLETFPEEEGVELILSADNPYSVDGMNSTEERLAKYGLTDDRIKVKHFLSREEYETYIKNGHVFVSCARSEGWNIPLIEAMVSGTPAIYSNWGAQLEFAKGKGLPVNIVDERPASIGAELGFARDTPGLYAEPDFEDLKRALLDSYENWGIHKQKAREDANKIYNDFNWERVGREGYEALTKVFYTDPKTARKDEVAVVLSHADTEEKISILRRNVIALKNQGLSVIISSHIEVPQEFYGIADFIVYDKENPVVYADEYDKYSDTVPIHYIRYDGFSLSYSFEFNHGLAAMRLIKTGLGLSNSHGYSTTHFVNYDYVIDDYGLLMAHHERLNEYDMVAYKWDEEESMNTAIFSARTQKLLDVMQKFDSKESYFMYPEKVILEDVMYCACKEANLTMWRDSIHSIEKGNVINTVILATYPRIKTNKSDACIYLAEDPIGDYYLCFIGALDTSIASKIKYRGKVKEFDLEIDHIVAFKIPYSILKDGFKVEFPEYGIIKEYDEFTKKAKCETPNERYVHELELDEVKEDIRYNINYINGAFVEILGNSDSLFKVEMIDRSSNKIMYSDELKSNHWAKSAAKYFIDWKIKITNLDTGNVYEQDLDLKGKRVYISMDSKALGDSLAWFPHMDEFRKKHGCELIVSTFKNELFMKEYPEITFVNPGEVVHNIIAQYRVGWFYGENGDINWEHHPNDFRKLPMQATTCDILGLPRTTIKPKLDMPEGGSPIEGKYVCISMHGTAQAKYWNNPTGWQELTDYFTNQGIKVITIGLEHDGYMGNYHPTGSIPKQGPDTLANVLLHLKHSEMFIGVGSGLSWLSWAVGIPTVMISGFSYPSTEIFDDNLIRIFKGGVCTGCFNRHRLDAGDWNWCPDHKGTDRQFECTKSISSIDVIREIERYYELGRAEKSVEIIVQESYELGMVQNHKEILGAAKFFKNLNATNFMEIGTDQGGSFAIWSKLSNDGIRISVDLPHGQFGRSDYDEYERDEYLKSLGSNVHMFWGSSHDTEMLDQVEQVLNGTKLDFLFIDGDHTYEGVKKDYEMYKHLVKSGGWIGFHDVKDTQFHRDANCRVDQLWNELSGEKIEFLDNRSHFGGIGFVRV